MPDYINIYKDLILEKFPEKLNYKEVENFFSKSEHSNLEIIKINDFIHSSKITSSENQKLRSYDKKSILQILKYQKDNKLSNICVASEYKLSRNTVAKWKKLFVEKQFN